MRTTVEGEIRGRKKQPPWIIDALRSQHATSAISGAGAGAIAAVMVCPLDVVKTRLQISGAGELSYRTIYGGLASIARTEGIAGLYCGLTPSLIALLPNWAVYFSVYEGMKAMFAKSGAAHRARQGKPLSAEAARAQESSDRRRTHLVNMAAAACAGAATVFTTNPLWVAKTRLQVQSMVSLSSRASSPAWNLRKYSGTWDCVSRIAKEEGIGGLYSGLGPSLLGVGHVMIQFPVYEAGKAWLIEGGARGEERELSTAELIGVSSVAKLAASLVSYPHEVLRSRMHVQGTGPFSGMGRIAKAVWADGKFKGMYRGFATSLVRTVPAGAVTITSFELISRQLNAATAALAARFEEESSDEKEKAQ